MKKYLKALLALMLALACVLACISCKKQDGTGDNNESNGNSNVDDSNKTDDTNKPGNENESGGGNVVTPPPSDGDEIEEETYRIRFVYSYTAKVVNDNGRTENKKEVKTVKSIYIDVDNNGLTSKELAEIAGLTYNGYSFVSWHAEWDTDAQEAKDSAVDFAAMGKVSKDLTFYGERGNLAGANATWRVEYEYPEVEEEEDVTPTAADGETPNEALAPIGATLYIEGTGAMFDFANGNEIDVKWFKDQKIIHTVVISDGITHVGSNSFKNFTKLAKVEFPDSIESIGDSAFLGIGLRKLTTPANLVRIDKNAFASTSLREVILNDKLEVLAERAFYGSSKISSIVVPTTLKSVGNSAFHAGSGNGTHNLNNGKVFYLGDEAGFKSIDVAMDNQSFAEFATIYYYIKTPDNYGTDEYKEILGQYWHYADEDAKLHPVQYCFTLTYTNEASELPFHTITVPARPQYDAAGDPVLDDEGAPVLKATITLDVYNQHKSITYNGYTYETFSGGTVPKVGTVLSGDQSYKCGRNFGLSPDGGIRASVAGDVITVYKDETTETRIRADVEEILKAYIYSELTDEEIAAIEADINAKIENGEIKLEKNQTAQTYISVAINDLVDEKFAANLLDAEYNASYESKVAERLAKAYAMWDFKGTTDTGLLWTGKLADLPKFKKVVIEDGVEYIGAYAFTSLSSITEITIPATVKGIDKYAFDGCSGLKFVYYEANIDEECPTLNAIASRRTNVYSLASGATSESGKYWMDIDGVRIAWILDLETGSLTIGGNNAMVNFASADAAPWYGAKDSITSVTIADNIVSLGTYILYGYENVVDLSLPRVLVTIPESSLAGTGIINNTDNYDKGLLVVDYHLLKVDATKRDEYFFETPYGLYTIADGAFAGCSSIKRIYITNTIKRINPEAFPDSDFEYVFLDGDVSLWNSLDEYVDLGDATVLLRSDKRPYDTETKKYISGKYWRLVGKEYCVWGCAHEWTDWIETTPATCSKTGTLTRYCVFDKQHKEYQEIPCIDHVYGEYVSDNNATCVTPLTETAECTNPACDSTSTRDVEVPVLDENDQPVLNEDGTPKTEKVYGECVFNEDAYVENGDRNCVNAMTATATCANEGCGKTDTKEVAEKSALGHIGRAESGEDIAWADVAYTLDADSATCVKPYGTKSKTCARCADVDGFDCGAVETIDATAEDHPEGYVPATCVYDATVVAAKYLASAATKTSPAKYYKSCKVCGAAGTETFDEGNALSFYDFEAENQKATDMCSATANYEFDPADVSTTKNYFKITSLTENDVTNKVLAVGRGSVVANGWGLGNIANNNAKTAEDAVYVIDTDFMVDSFEFSGSDNWLTRISMYNANSGAGKFATVYLRKASDTTLSLSVAENESTSEKSTGIVLNVDTWYNIRLEYDVAGKTFAVSVTEKANAENTNSYKYEDFVPTVDATTFSAMRFELRASTDYIVNTQYLFDNLYMGAVSYAELYGERPAVEETPAE